MLLYPWVNGTIGWGGWDRTSEWGSQSPLPYRLATPQLNQMRIWIKFLLNSLNVKGILWLDTLVHYPYYLSRNWFTLVRFNGLVRIIVPLGTNAILLMLTIHEGLILITFLAKGMIGVDEWIDSINQFLICFLEGLNVTKILVDDGITSFHVLLKFADAILHVVEFGLLNKHLLILLYVL